MKKTIKALKFSAALILITSSFIACDKDFTNIDSDVISEDNVNFKKGQENLNILAYSKKLKSLQINGLNSNVLGVFHDPAFGTTTSSIVAQIVPTTYNPDFGDNPVIDSVVLKIPYYNRAITDSTYTISDSLYGSGEIKLSIFKNDYFLRSFNPGNITQSQRYFSKGDKEINATDNFVLNGSSTINFDEHKSETILEIPNFTPSAKRIKLYKFDDEGEIADTEYLTPALREKLDPTFWKTTILDKEGSTELSSANSFANYFRGLYFKAEAISPETGSAILINMQSSNANIVIYYSKDSTVEGERTQSTYTFNFKGNILNPMINDFSIPLEDGNSTDGDEKVFIKGSEGSLGIVELFKSEAELETFKKTYRKTDESGEYIKDRNGEFILKRLINDAQLIITEDENIEVGENEDFHKYDRLYVYDVKNNIPIVDYSVDPLENTQVPFNSKILHLGQRITNEDSGTSKYKIRLTEHLINVLKRDSTNNKIGLCLSTNVNYITNSRILNGEDDINAVPASSLITPRGTVLYGTNVSSTDENKKMKLEVYFTESKLNE
ncbi:DUF4270 domain-containing protein [Gaetbulibacter saemankumensis]|uniref:DUF4270 domain-containing protein n=1 Tax=Gaetbulibacter saemankumensis TaxID=311208 RepID=UPI000402CDFC|nr:DUF4270 domain-containing protein [Gaetbulibacter saemankumensis]